MRITTRLRPLLGLEEPRVLDVTFDDEGLVVRRGTGLVHALNTSATCPAAR